jgi:hypothetical protein
MQNLSVLNIILLLLLLLTDSTKKLFSERLGEHLKKKAKHSRSGSRPLGTPEFSGRARVS